MWKLDTKIFNSVVYERTERDELKLTLEGRVKNDSKIFNNVKNVDTKIFSSVLREEKLEMKIL